MHIWIDAEPSRLAPEICGYTTLERVLRSIAKEAGATANTVYVSGMPDVPNDPRYTVLNDDGTAGERLGKFLETTEGPVLALDGGAVTDTRLLPLMMALEEPACFVSGAGETGSAILRLASSTSPAKEAGSLREIADELVSTGAVRRADATEFSDFIQNLRRNVPFTLERMPDEQARDALEKRLFHLNYKGSTDFMTKWVYPPIVWVLVRLCIRWKITPNMVTIFSIFLTILAIPLFALGYWLAGFAAAYAMTILDSVDGKLARLTLTDSAIGNILDHGLDIVHPPFWYAAWAMGLSISNPDFPLFDATLWLIFFYIADRLALMVAKKRFGRGLHAVTPLDGFVRTWIARRNVNLVVFTLGVAVGLGPEAFIFITVWQGLTFVWHSLRTAWLYPKARHEPMLT
ncbi:MAG: CDP-alcohol phosphatidyltransferase family protein [Roseobacter sp.]|jgi:phosphatidylglycerophosphate synthase